MSNNNTVVLAFCCNEIYRLIQKSSIPAIALPNENLSEIRVLPKKAKTKLYSDGRYGTCLAVTKYIPKNAVTPDNRNRKVKVLINPQEFGLTLESSIEDIDGISLFDIIKGFSFQLYPIRSTCNNQMGDLLVLRKGKFYSLHITRFNPTVNRIDSRLRLRHYIIGKIAFQTYNAKTKQAPKCIFIMHKDLLDKKIVTQKVLAFFTSLDLQVILSDFKTNWQQTVAQELVKITETTNSSA